MTILTPTGQTKTIPAGTRWRDGDTHFTDHETPESLAAMGYTVLPDPVPPTPPTEAEQLAAQAAALWASPDLRDAVAGVLARVAAVAALGVAIEDWSFQGVTAAAEAALAAGSADAVAILTASVALRTAWDRVVYHTGDMRTADVLWPYLYDLAVTASQQSV